MCVKTKVFGRFKFCQKYPRKTLYCLCSIYIRVNVGNSPEPEHIFIDACNHDRFDPTFKHHLEFRSFYESVDHVYDNVNCSQNVPNNDNWDDIPLSLNHFKCARIKSPCNRYLVRNYIFQRLHFFVA